MFNWIQIYLTKHYKWLLIALLALMIVSFVFTIGNFSPLSRSGPQQYREQPFLDLDLSLARDEQVVFGRGQLSLLMNYPSFFGMPSSEMVGNYSLSRQMFLYLANKMGMPGPNQEQFKEFVHGLAAFQNFSTQEFDQNQFNTFVNSLEARGWSEALMTSVLEEDYKVQRVQELLGGPSHILPIEAIHAAEMANTNWTLETASLSYESFTADVNPTEEELKNFYENNQFRYVVDEKVKAGYLLFEPAKFLEKDYNPEPGEKSIHFFTNKARYQAAQPKPEPITKDDGTIETPEAPEVTLEMVEDQVIEEIRLDRAKEKARAAAEEFAYSLYDNDILMDSPAFNKAVATAGLTLKQLVPFPESAVIMQDGLTPSTLDEVFRLNDSRYYSDPIKNGDNYVILIYQGTEDSYTPSLEEVKAKVAADYKEQEKRAHFIEKGAQLKETILAAIASGKSFALAAEEEKLTHKAYDAFKRSETPPEGLNSSILPQLDNLNEGDVSDWIATDTEGMLVYAVKKEVPSYDKDSEEVKTFIDRQGAGTSNVQFVIGERLSKELANTRFGQENI